MKNQLFSFAFISAFWFFCVGPATNAHAQANFFEENDPHIKGPLKGPVKSMEIREGLTFLYIFNRAGNIVEKSAIYRSDNRVSGKLVNLYDASGKKTGSEYYVETKLKTKTVINYDDRGNALEILEYDAAGGLDFKTVKKYDTRGNVLEISGKMPWGIVGLGPSKPIDYRDIFKYDENGRVIEKQSFLGDVKVPLESRLFEYNAENRVFCETEISQTYLDKAPRIAKRFYTYNTRGDVIESRHYEPVKESNVEELGDKFQIVDDKGTVRNGTLISDKPFMILWSVSICNYKYDRYGNWTEHSCASNMRDTRDFVPAGSVNRRTITYYQ